MTPEGNLPPHPEESGEAPSKERLAAKFFDTIVTAPIKRRFQNSDGKYIFPSEERSLPLIAFAQDAHEFALKMHEEKPADSLSPIYLSIRNLPDAMYKEAGAVMVGLETDQKPEFVTGIPKAGVPLAKAYAESSGATYVDIFEKEITEDRRRIVGGSEGSGKLRIIDDLITKAGTKLEAISAAKAMGYEVTDIVVLVDREQGGVEELARQGVKVHSVFTLTELLDFGLKTQRISKENFDKALEYLAANQ